MMEKKKFLLLIIMLVSFLFIGKVSAAEGDTCSAIDLNALRTEAANVRATYVPAKISVVNKEYVNNAEGGEAAEYVQNVLDLKVYNVNSKFLVRYDYSGKGVKTGTMTRDYTNIGPDGAITIRQKAGDKVVNYVITILANYGTCAGETLRTLRVTLPKFNFYSVLDVCQGVQDYYLCQPYITYDFDATTLFDKVSEYKAKLMESKEIDFEEDNNGAFSGALSGISKHKYLIVGIIVAAGVAATVVILRRKKSEA